MEESERRYTDIWSCLIYVEYWGNKLSRVLYKLSAGTRRFSTLELHLKTLQMHIQSVLLHSVHLHAQLSRITAIVQLCYSIRQLQMSEYTYWWENQIIAHSMSYPGTIGGVVTISTSGNRATSSWPLYVTSNNKLSRHSRKMPNEERDKATSLYILYMVYM